MSKRRIKGIPIPGAPSPQTIMLPRRARPDHAQPADRDDEFEIEFVFEPAEGFGPH